MAWKDVLTDTIVHCLKCGFKKSEANNTCKYSEIDEKLATLLIQLRDNDDITLEDFIPFDYNVTTPPDQIKNHFLERKSWGAIENIVHNDLDSNESHSQEVISDDEDHEDTVCSELTTSRAL